MRQITSFFVVSLLVAAPSFASAPAAALQTPKPATAPAAPTVRIGGQTKAPERIKYVAPVYPEVALAARLSGVVIVEATVGKDGSVTDAHVIRSIALLDQAALDAVKQWKYTPTTMNGVPVPVIMTVTVSFTPPGETPRATSPTPQAAEAPAAPKAADSRIDQSDVNIELTVKITDTGASGTQTKVVSVIMVNRGNGRVRSNGSTTTSPSSSRSSELNVDARANLLRSGPGVGSVISTFLTITYTPEWTDEVTKFTGVSQSVEVLLKDGVPMVIARAADPTRGSRAVTIEATASIRK